MLIIKQLVRQNKTRLGTFLAKSSVPSLVNPLPMQHNMASNSAVQTARKYFSLFNFNKALFIIIGSLTANALMSCTSSSAEQEKNKPIVVKDSTIKADSVVHTVMPLVLDTALYNEKMVRIVNGDSSGRWPVKTAYPEAGAILPFKRIVAYYGNLYSKKMGVLGE